MPFIITVTDKQSSLFHLQLLKKDKKDEDEKTLYYESRKIIKMSTGQQISPVVAC